MSNSNTLSIAQQLAERKARLTQSIQQNTSTSINNNAIGNYTAESATQPQHIESNIRNVTDGTIDTDHEIALQLQRRFNQQNSNINLSTSYDNSQSSQSSASEFMRFAVPNNFSYSVTTVNDGNGNIETIYNGNNHNIMHTIHPFPPMINMNIMFNNLMRGNNNGLFTFLQPNINRAQVADQQSIDALPTDTYKEQKEQNENEDEDAEHTNKETCSICLQEFKHGDEIRRLPCLHIFHKNEIDRWLLTGNDKCPICRMHINQSN